MDNARSYAAFAREYPTYRRTSQDLIALARVPPDAAVVDLACGTGVLTEVVLAVLGPHGQVIGVDGSPAMLAVAEESVRDRRVRWVESQAEHLDRAVTGPVDVVACNSAIWQTDLARTFRATRAVLHPGGRLVFNVGEDMLSPPGHSGPRSPAGPALTELMQAIAARDHGWSAPPRRRPRPALSEQALAARLRDSGFTVESVRRLGYDSSAEEFRAWLSVPIFTEQCLPGLPYSQRMAVLEQACREQPLKPTTETWVAFVAVVADGSTCRSAHKRAKSALAAAEHAV
jgi:SAM-dependent methyltransferase